MPDRTTSATSTQRSGERTRDTTTHTEQMTQHETRRRETDRTPTDDDPSKRTLGEVSHTNPHTDRTFGTTQTFGRGRTIAADGGRADAAPQDDPETLEDVDHTTDEDDVDGAQGTFDRGRTAPDDEPDDE